MANWQLVGELTVSNNWQIFPNDVISELFRVTTIIQNLDDWNKWKFKSAAYLRFYYADGSTSPAYYIKVNDTTILRDFTIPVPLLTAGYQIRTPGIVRASKYLPITPNSNFAQWNLKLEAWH